jgi:hypothetical protein
VQKVSSGKVSVDDKLGKCAAVRIVVCDDEARPQHTSIVSITMLVFLLRTMKSLCAEPKDGASQTDRDGMMMSRSTDPRSRQGP